MTLKIKRLRPGAKLPERATQGAAGYDLAACIEGPLTLPAGGCLLIPTGIAAALPEGTVGLVFGRSGLGVRHQIAPANAVGVIDSDYRGEIAVGLKNSSQNDYIIKPGERIAQLVIVPALTPPVEEAGRLDGTARSSGGFGSTGKD